MKKASFDTYFTIYWASLIVSVLTLTILKLFYTDMATGFINTSTVLGFMLNMIQRLSLIIPIGFWFYQTIKRRARHDFPVSYRHIPTSILSIITGIAMIVYSVKIVPGKIIAKEIIAETLFNNKLLVMSSFILGIVGGISMLVGGIHPRYGRHGKPGAMLGFCPAVWQLILLLSLFNSFISVTTISDILLNILFMCFASVFLLGQARIVYGLGTRNGKSYAIPTGFSVSLVGLSYAIPNIFLFIKNKSLAAPLVMSIPEYIYILSLSLYAIVFLVGYSKSIQKV